jgi:hypothetical protein
VGSVSENWVATVPVIPTDPVVVAEAKPNTASANKDAITNFFI